jgi:hypothetical protein
LQGAVAEDGGDCGGFFCVELECCGDDDSVSALPFVNLLAVFFDDCSGIVVGDVEVRVALDDGVEAIDGF